MGIELVKASMHYGRRLSGNAYKALLTMSMSALDKPNSEGRPAAVYFGGWDALAVALGHEDAARNTAGHKAVKRAVRELRDGDFISPNVTACRGSRQSYSVHPGGPTKGAQNDPVMRGQNDPVKGAQNDPQSGVKMTPPRKDVGVTGLISDSITHPRAQVTPARTEAPEPHGFKGRPGDDCETCGLSHLDRRIHPLWLVEGA